MSSPLPYIPTRLVRYDEDQPAPHCSLRQVRFALAGADLRAFQDPAGSLDPFWQNVDQLVIPEVSAEVVRRIRQPLDWCRTIAYEDGNGGFELTLPHRYMYDVNLCYMRVLPSLPFYAFQRVRNVDGTEFSRILAVEPKPFPPESMPPVPVVAQYASSLIFTGIEDADLFVDTRARTLRIPPRVLVAGVGLPLANFAFIAGTKNIEVHYRFGFPPTKYADGSALQFGDPDANGNMPVADPKPGADDVLIDWSSGMPAAFSMKVARLVANKILRPKWRAANQGVSSMSVDGASESYGGGPYAGDLDAESEAIYRDLEQYGLTSVF